MAVKTERAPAPYFYCPKKEIPSSSTKKSHIRLFQMAMEPLRKSIGKYYGKQIADLHLNKEEKSALLAQKKAFLAKKEVETLTIPIQNKKGKQTHQIDGVSIQGNKKQKYIVVFFGIGDCYEKHLDALHDLSKRTGATVIGFNYRGVLESSGRADKAADYIEDGQAVVDYLQKQKNAGLKDILLYGHSLGGGVAAQVNSLCPIILESTFGNFCQGVKEKRGASLAWLFRKIGWNFNTLKKCKNQNIGIIVNRRDPTLNYQKTSYYKGLKKNNPDFAKKIPLIKIGCKEEDLAKTDVKIRLKKSSLKSPGSSEARDPDGYQSTIRKIKKQNLIRHLRHPHHPIMDHAKAKENQLPESLQENSEMAKNLAALQKKYLEEDKKAYEGILLMIKEMLDIKKISS